MRCGRSVPGGRAASWPAGHVLATDIAPPMLDAVAAQARAVGLAMVATHACAAENLPRDRQPFDAAICRLGRMLPPNPGAALTAVWDVLRLGGRFSGLVMAHPEGNCGWLCRANPISYHERTGIGVTVCVDQVD